MARICWSHSPDYVISEDESDKGTKIDRGTWAGDRFDIVALDDFKKGALAGDIGRM